MFDSKNLQVELESDFIEKSLYATLFSKYTDVTGTLLNGTSWYYNLECKLDFSEVDSNEDFIFKHNDKVFELSDSYFSVSSGDTIRILTDSNNFTGYITYRVTNKETGQVVLIKKITVTGTATGSNITGSTIYENDTDYTDNTNGKEDYSSIINNNPYNSVSNTDSIMDIINGNNETISTITYILELFPDWLTGPILFFISSIVVIAIIKKIIE